MGSSNISEALCRRLTGERASLVGYADLRPLPAQVRQSLPFAVSIAVGLDPSIVAGVLSGPTRAYYAEYKRANLALGRLAKVAIQELRGAGYQAVPTAPTGVEVDPATQSTPLPHKTVATRAGLGWIGKCALLITPGYGSAVRLTSVLTDAPLGVGVPVERSRCGDCDLCVRRCPVGAPSGSEWDVHTHRDAFLDVFACRNAARARAAALGIQETICGICIAACPWTQRYIASADTAVG